MFKDDASISVIVNKNKYDAFISVKIGNFEKIISIENYQRWHFYLVSLLNLLKDDASSSVIENINQRCRFLKASLVTKTYNDRPGDDTLEKRHLTPLLTLKKRH